MQGGIALMSCREESSGPMYPSLLNQQGQAGEPFQAKNADRKTWDHGCFSPSFLHLPLSS